MPETISLKCDNCGAVFEKTKSQLKDSAHHFCTQSCSASFTNKHREQGKKVSKIEQWLNPRLQSMFPDLEIQFNRKDAINSELDIYVPSLSLAVELHGELHYKPIFSQSMLESIQRNDREKKELCEKSGITLKVVDTSECNYITTKLGYKYLRLVSDVIKERLNENLDPK